MNESLKPRIIYLVEYLCCKTEQKTQHEFLPKTKDFEVSLYIYHFSTVIDFSSEILKCLWSKNFELQKCGHIEKIKLWAKFVNHFDVFDNLWSRKIAV